MFGINGMELFLILLFGFLIFGPDKIPEIAKTVGQAIAKFRSAQTEMNKVLKTEIYDPNSDEPFKNPLDTLAKVTGANKQEQTESFSERKDRYDKQRAAKKKAEERKKAAAALTVGAGTSAEKKIIDESQAQKTSELTPEKPKPNVEELYNSKPAALKAKKAVTPTAHVSESSKNTSVPKPLDVATADKRPASSKPGPKPQARTVAAKDQDTSSASHRSLKTPDAADASTHTANKKEEEK